MNKEIIDYKGYEIEIIQDEHAGNPRKQFDHMGTFVAMHRSYDLGDKTNFRDADEVMQHIKDTKAVYLPVYMYEHGGISLSTGSFNDAWDSGQLGVIFVEREKILKEYSVKSLTKQVKETVISLLKAEIDEMDMYVRGDVYGFNILKPHKCDKCSSDQSESIDSCWGFYGYELCVEEAKAVVDSYVKEGVATNV